MKFKLDVQRDWIIGKLESGELDNVQFGYFNRKINGEYYYSHADALAQIRDKVKSSPTRKAEEVVETERLTTPDKPLNIYTDGSDIKGTGQIGYGVWFEHNGKEYAKSGIENVEAFKRAYNISDNVSNPTMELMATVEALRAFANKPEHLVISMDYEGVIKWFSGQYKAKKPYIKSLLAEGQEYIKSIEDAGGSVQLKWVKGHSGVRGNEKVDAIAKDRTEYDNLQQVYEDNKGNRVVGEDNETTLTEDNEFKFGLGVTVPTGKIKVNEQQSKALDEIAYFIDSRDRKTHALIGYAGTGKSTVINIINEFIKEAGEDIPIMSVQYTTPTHRANSVLKSKGLKNVTTLHSLLGLRPDVKLEEFDPTKPKFGQVSKPEMRYNGLLIIDESSMINDSLYELLLSVAEQRDTKILFVGDDAQLQPVEQDHRSKAFTKTEKTSKLTKVMRTGDNPLLAESMQLRNITNSGDFTYVSAKNEKGEGVTFTTSKNSFVDTVVDLFKSDEFKQDVNHVRVVAGTNDNVDALNSLIRDKLWGNAAVNEYNEGELLMGYENINDRDKNPIINNGLDYVIKEIQPASNILAGVEVEGYYATIEDYSQSKDSPYREKEVYILADSNSEQTKQVLGKKIAKAFAVAKTLKGKERARAYAQAYTLRDGFLTSFDIRLPGYEGPIKPASFKYGYAHTIHKSQGGTYRYTFINGDNVNRFRDEGVKRQLRYVAVTRSEAHSVIYSKRGDTNEVDLKGTESKFYTPLEGLAKEGEQVKDKCAPTSKGGGKAKAAKGLRDQKFHKGSKWSVVKDLKGAPTHKEGGIDLSISDNGHVKVTDMDGIIEAKNGLIIAGNE